MTTTASTPWQFTDSRGQLVTAPTRPRRIAAYIQAGASLYDHGLRPAGIFGSYHDGPTPDPAKSGGLPLADVTYFGAGPALDPDAVLAAGIDLLVAVSYGGSAVYGMEPDTAKHLEEHIPTVVLDIGQGRSLTEVRESFHALAETLGSTEPPEAAHELADAQAKLKSLISPSTRPLLALSPADDTDVHLARPHAWPDLRALSALGVPFLSPPPEGGVNWATVPWESAAALTLHVVLADTRINAAPFPPSRLGPDVQILPWNPELPASATAHTAFFTTVAEAPL
ncbi:ABC transporter substrate-binding protein [Streptomyces sp. NBC_00237]|uniref:ABC transporter substrate-binding protein n=1 Tax=Streptomyces sp. NBC_00237 TaxID=2975687 RepID=UPI0022565A2E|nr:ABC transporter substrate-binding protein [Streptomyces sp. NBC_00237]MCX5201137.1 ABC transporter substrate-binding protein [Streptomyces sp. NBC_00237]